MVVIGIACGGRPEADTGMSGINGIVIGVGEVALEPETRGGTLGEIGGGVRLGLRRTFGDAVGDEDTSMLRSSKELTSVESFFEMVCTTAINCEIWNCNSVTESR